MKRTILLLAVLALASVGVWGQRLSRPSNQYDWQVVHLEKPLHVHIDGNVLNKPPIVTPIVITRLRKKPLRVGQRIRIRRAQMLKELHSGDSDPSANIKYAHAQQPKDIMRGVVKLSPAPSKTHPVYVRYAHAQQQPKAVASVATPVSPPTDAPIPFPARAKVMIKDLDAEVEKLKKDYKSDEYDKELKALNEKYKIGEQNQKLQSLQKQYGLVLQLAVAEAGLTDEQQRTLTPAKSGSGEWQWVKVPPGPRQ